MKILVVGLGCFGWDWLETVLLPHEDINIIGLVDKNPDVLKRAQTLTGLPETALFTDINEALSQFRPDALLNFTPPNRHTEVNLAALARKIPILCEKPIAEDVAEAAMVLEQAQTLGVPVMIAENYRFLRLMRTARQIISSGEIGPVHSMQIDFARRHKMENYHRDLTHPLLLDVAIHHLDLVRYLSGAETKTVFARVWTPPGSWYQGYASAELLLEMAGGLNVSYRGTLAAWQNETGWFANWHIEGEKGVIKIIGNKIRVEQAHQTVQYEVTETADSRKLVLDEFIASLREKRAGETDLADNILTFGIVNAAIISAMKQEIVAITK